jgi:hypothetical protein
MASGNTPSHIFKNGMSAHQLWRMLGFGSYRTAWFMAHRIREGMTGNGNTHTGSLGGANKVVEIDECYVGGKAKNRAYRPETKKHIIMSLAERRGEVRQQFAAFVAEKPHRFIVQSDPQSSA